MKSNGCTQHGLGERLVSRRDLALHFHVSLPTISNWIRKHQIRVIRPHPGGALRIPVSELRKLGLEGLENDRR